MLACFDEVFCQLQPHHQLAGWSHGEYDYGERQRDRYVVERMRSIGANFGGESSGHLIFLDYGTTGDGIAAALKILRMEIEKDLPLSQLKKVFEPSARAIRNVFAKVKVPLEELKAFSVLLHESRVLMGDTGRILVRYSGTEPKARILVETFDQLGADSLADKLSLALTEALAT